MERRDELVERGWQQMSEILDREIPQNRPRRRLFIWIPIAVIGLLAVSYGTWASGILGGNDVKDTKPVQTEKTKVNQADEHILSSQFKEESISPELMEVEHSSAVTDEKSDVETETIASNVETSVVIDNPKESENSFSQPSNSQSNSALRGIDSSGELANYRQVLEEVATVPGITPTDMASSGDVDGSRIAPVMADRFNFPVSYAESIAPSTLAADKQTVSSIAPSSELFDKTFGLGAYVASHWDGPVTLQGIEAGLLLSWDFTRRWSITSGLAYGHHRKLGIADLSPGKSDDQELALNPNDPDTTNFGGVTTVDLSRVSYDTAETLINKLNYLHIPLHVEFKATRGLSLRAGVRASYMMGAPVSQMGREFIAQPQFSNNVLVDANSSARFLLKEGVVRRWDVAPMVGVGWDITRLLTIDVQYQHGIIPYIDREAVERSDFNSTLSVGLRMKIL